jgi:uncharacterized protein (DUF1697 family)
MTRFVVFLRAINVGGLIVVKGKLQDAFVSMGFRDVLTYKQSGNVILEADSDAEHIQKLIAQKLPEQLGFNVGVFVRTIPQLKRIVEIDPFKGQPTEGSSFLVTFIATAPEKFPFKFPFTIPNSSAQIISASGAEVFSVTHGGGEGGLPNPFLEKTLKTQATTRNLNIVREIAEKLS